MNKKKDNQRDKSIWIQTAGIACISLCAFFIITWGGCVIESRYTHVLDFITDYITGDGIITHKDNPSPGSFILENDMVFRADLFPIEQYQVLEELLRNNEEVVSFTPFTLYPALVLNTERKQEAVLFKIIDPVSFSRVFLHITFTHTNGLLPDFTEGLYLPPAVTDRIRKLYKNPLAQERFIIIADEDGALTSAREIYYAGGVIYKNFSPFLPLTGYGDYGSFPLGTTSKDEQTRAQGIIKSSIPEADTFYTTIVDSQPVIERKILSDEYFFEFFTYTDRPEKTNGTTGEKNNTHNPKTEKNSLSGEKHYIALLKAGSSGGQTFRDKIIRQCLDLGLAVRLYSPEDIAAPYEKPIDAQKIFLYIITLVFLILLFIIVTVTMKSRARLAHNSDTGKGFLMFQRNIISLVLTLVLSGIAGIMGGIIGVPLINNAHFPVRLDSMNLIQSGGPVISLSVFPVPIIISVLLVFITTIILCIYPLLLLKKLPLKITDPGQGR